MIIQILSLLCEGSKSCIRVGMEQTAWFGVDSGVIQGDSLSLILFNLVLDYVMTKLGTVDGEINWITGKRLKDLDYVDDICLFAKDKDSLKAMTEIFVAEARKIGLKINTRKTEIKKIRCAQSQGVTIDGSNLKEMKKFI